MRWEEEGLDQGGIKGSRFFSCSNVFVFVVVTVLPLITLFFRGVYSQPSSPVPHNHPIYFRFIKLGGWEINDDGLL